jgi:hypothetical protein
MESSLIGPLWLAQWKKDGRVSHENAGPLGAYAAVAVPTRAVVHRPNRMRLAWLRAKCRAVCRVRV